MCLIGKTFFQGTAAQTYGVNKETVSENLIKINVYYTSLNEKFVEDKIDYSLEVKDLPDIFSNLNCL